MLNNLAYMDPWTLAFAGALGSAAGPLVCAGLNAIRRSLSTAGQESSSGRQTRRYDQLEAIEGIGPEIARRLRSQGIYSFHALALESTAELRDKLNSWGEDFGLARAYSWPVQAALLDRGNIEAFLQLVVALKAGVPRLESIDGIGQAFAEALRANGIRSIDALSDSDGKAIRQALGTDERIGDEEIQRWKEQADRFIAGDQKEILGIAGLSSASLNPLPTTISDPAESVFDPPDAINTPRLGVRADSFCIWCSAILGIFIGGLLLILCSVERFCPEGCKVIGCKKPNVCMLRPPVKLCPKIERTSIPTDGLFDYNERVTNGKSAQKLDQFVNDLLSKKALPLSVTTIGHADRFGSDRYNLQLSRDRADGIEQFLREKTGWPADLFISYGRGETQPKTGAECAHHSQPTTDARLCLERDRRVDIMAVFEVREPSSLAR